jgi:hypothetical protein
MPSIRLTLEVFVIEDDRSMLKPFPGVPIGLRLEGLDDGGSVVDDLSLEVAHLLITIALE